MKYEWDNEKYKRNLNKHGIRFEMAQTVFADPFAIEYFDEENSFSEDRYIRIGLSSLSGVLFVVFCEKTTVEGEEIVRIISARKAERDEEDKYYES